MSYVARPTRGSAWNRGLPVRPALRVEVRCRSVHCTPRCEGRNERRDYAARWVPVAPQVGGKDSGRSSLLDGKREYRWCDPTNEAGYSQAWSALILRSGTALSGRSDKWARDRLWIAAPRRPRASASTNSVGEAMDGCCLDRNACESSQPASTAMTGGAGSAARTQRERKPWWHSDVVGSISCPRGELMSATLA
jgi:hypothetical protein